ncbi:ribosomal protein S18-alanine N-acetyltransferase [Streptococcus sp. X13SY08]|uniref:ribosomal protein S18-alanine N-acetyltransferase n=1 Tax=unclassified Streptococcus TaxID=2608887 RepID=UPI000A94B162|nr:ribosomal protein S18-alanine N-acetyltransferase [Streptococcus sp. X13SY08]
MTDTEAIYGLMTEVYGGQSPWTMQQIAADMQQDQTDYNLIWQDDRLVAFCAIQDLAGELELTQISVTKDYQGQGFASQLMEKLTARVETIFLEVRVGNSSAISLYKKFGFKEVGRRKSYYHEPIEDALVMVREGKEE